MEKFSMFRALTGLLRGLVLAVALLVPIAASAAPTAQLQATTPSKYQPGQVIVTFRKTATDAEKARVLARYSVLRETAGLYRLSVPDGLEAETAKALSADPAVDIAAPNEKLFFPVRPAQAKAAAAMRAVAAHETTEDTSTPEATATPSALTPTPSPTATTGLSPVITRFWLSDVQRGD